MHMEECGDECWVEFDLFHPFPLPIESTPRVRITFSRFLAARMDFMSEVPYGIGVLDESVWLDRLNARQLQRFPQFPDHFRKVRHFYFTGHDTKVEVLAEGCCWAYVRSAPESVAG